MRQEARRSGFEAALAMDKAICLEFLKVYPRESTRAGKMAGVWGTPEATDELCRREVQAVRDSSYADCSVADDATSASLAL